MKNGNSILQSCNRKGKGKGTGVAASGLGKRCTHFLPLPALGRPGQAGWPAALPPSLPAPGQSFPVMK